jgi:hypothetical protein
LNSNSLTVTVAFWLGAIGVSILNIAISLIVVLYFKRR